VGFFNVPEYALLLVCSGFCVLQFVSFLFIYP